MGRKCVSKQPNRSVTRSQDKNADRYLVKHVNRSPNRNASNKNDRNASKFHDKNAQKSQNENVKRSPEKFANNQRTVGGKEIILTETTSTDSEYTLEYIHILTLFILLPPELKLIDNYLDKRNGDRKIVSDF